MFDEFGLEKGDGFSISDVGEFDDCFAVEVWEIVGYRLDCGGKEL